MKSLKLVDVLGIEEFFDVSCILRDGTRALDDGYALAIFDTSRAVRVL